MKPSDKLDPMMGNTACGVLEDMRKSFETRNFAPVLAYIEELQAMFNRMESALELYSDSYGGIAYMQQKLRDLRKEKRELLVEIAELKEKRDTLTDDA